jgi:hypothetical protein
VVSQLNDTDSRAFTSLDELAVKCAHILVSRRTTKKGNYYLAVLAAGSGSGGYALVASPHFLSPSLSYDTYGSPSISC